MSVAINVFLDKFRETKIEQHNSDHDITLHDWLEENVCNYDPNEAAPFSASVNAKVLEESDWNQYKFVKGDIVDLVIEPKEPATIVLAVIAVVSAGIAIYAANQIPDNYNATVPSGSSIYDVNAQGNRPRLMGVIPEIAGRHKIYPDLLNQPRKDFINNEQWLYLMMAVGVGEYEINSDEIFIGNTPVSNYSGDIEYTVFAPGADVTGHDAHRNIYSSIEVGGSSGNSGLEVKGPLLLTTTNEGDTDRAIFSANKVKIQKKQVRNVGGGEYETFYVDHAWRWPVGHHVLISNADATGASFQGNVDLVDAGDDGGDPPTDLPDKIQAPFGLSVFGVGDTIQLIGSGPNDGTYKIATVSDTEITLNDTSDNPVTWLVPATTVNVTIIRTDSNDGLYRIVSIDSNNWATVQKVDSGDLSDLAGWSAFNNATLTGVTFQVHESDLVGDEIGPFFACPENETTENIYLDFKLIKGLGRLTDSGFINSRTVDIEIRYREEGTTPWTLVTHQFSDNTNDQLAETVAINLSGAMRPEVKVIRITSEEDDTKLFDKIEWTALKSELESASSYPDVTTLAVKIRGTNALSSAAENKFNLVCTRKLPVYSGGAWSAAQTTKDIAPFFAHVIKDVGHTDEQLVLDELEALHTLWNGRTDDFNAVFDNESTLFEVLKRVLAPGYAVPTLDYGQIIPVRDEAKTVWEQQYQPDNMRKPGLKRDITLIDYDEPDGVEVEYFDSSTWKAETVMCLLAGDLGANPLKVKAFGITDKTKAWRYGMRKRRERKYRRTQFTFNTEMDALNSSYMSYVALGDDIPGYSQTGRVEAFDSRFVTLDQKAEFGSGTHYLALRKPDGTLSGPYQALETSNPYVVQIDSDIDFTPVFDGRQEPPLYQFGDATRWTHAALITDINPSGTDTVSVKATNYDARVYADDDNSPA